MTNTDPLANLRHRADANPVTGTPEEMRRAFRRLAGPQPALPTAVHGDVTCTVAGSGPSVAIWLHGGGYVFGGADSHGHAAATLADLLDGTVLMPHYPLAPEATWPAQLICALQVIDAQPDPVHLVGDSAGGHLALNAAYARPDRIRSLSLISPNTDRSGQSDTRVPNSAHDWMNDDEQDRALARLAMPQLAGGDPQASPLLGPLHVLPRLFVTYSRSEVLADDSRLLIEAAGDHDVPITSHVMDGVPHMWTLWPQHLPQAAHSLERIARFISTQ